MSNEYEWVERDEIQGAGMSSRIYGDTTLENGVTVEKMVYYPGPFHAAAYGEDSPENQITEHFWVCTQTEIIKPELAEHATDIDENEDGWWFMEFDNEQHAIAYARGVKCRGEK